MTASAAVVIKSMAQLDALPVGSVIAEIRVPDSPAVACRAVIGWQFIGDDPERRYESSALFSDYETCPVNHIIVLYTPKEARS